MQITLDLETLVLYGLSLVCPLLLVGAAWFQKRLDEEFDAGFRAGQNPEAGGWEYHGDLVVSGE